MSVREHATYCEWCEAVTDEPCKDMDGNSYTNGMIHRTRRKSYDEMQRLIKNRPTNLLPPKPRSMRKTRCIR